MTKGFWGFATLFIAATIASCGGSKKVTTTETPKEEKKKEERSRAKIACAGLLKDSKEPRLDCIIERDSVLDNLTTLPKPAGYKVYSLDTLQAKEFFAAVKDTNRKLSVVMPLPAPLGCKVYGLGHTGVMNKKLADKYPEMVVLQGTDQQGATNLRLNYDGKWLKAQVMASGKTYMINPVRNNGNIYYMVYAREDSKEKKEPFEGDGGKTTK